jgi:8-oxo-dGTP pyrophosphatase MutT (NUDIX family)
MSSLLDRLLRPLANAAYRVVRKRARGRLGVHAIALTPERRVILVKLRYARGWRLPGGGRGEHEDPCEAGLRELREEIGMTSHAKVGLALPGDDELILVRNVQYHPRRWSWEVQDIMEAALNDLPPGLSPISQRWLRAARGRI